jgi:hypothetical protein
VSSISQSIYQAIARKSPPMRCSVPLCSILVHCFVLRPLHAMLCILPCCYSYRLPFFLATALLNPGVDSLTLPIICWNNSLSAMPFSRSFSCCVALAWRANTDTQVFAATHPTEPNRTEPTPPGQYPTATTTTTMTTTARWLGVAYLCLS